MPSPPRKDESHNAFISRCMSYLIKNEKKTSDQAAGQCYGMWRQQHKIAEKAGKARKK